MVSCLAGRIVGSFLILEFFRDGPMGSHFVNNNAKGDVKSKLRRLMTMMMKFY